MNDKELQEIKTRWYKDPTLLASPEAVSRQAVTDIKALLSTIEGLKGEVERLKQEKEAAFVDSEHFAEVCEENEQLREDAKRYKTALEEIKAMLDMDRSEYQKFLIWNLANKALQGSE